jgi:putative phosphoribosyl transferase
MSFPGKPFRNRKDAGEKLGSLLDKFKGSNALVLGIPRGGVEVAYYIAQYIQAELSVIISKKLSHPKQEEFGFGAVSEENELYLPNENFGFSREVTDEIIEDRKREINRRIQEFRQGEPLPEMRGRTVLLIDDGIATGVTLVPAIRVCRKHKASRIVVASPVSGKTYDRHLKEADELYIYVQPEGFFSVIQVYDDFMQLTDEEVQFFLKKRKQELRSSIWNGNS